MRKVLVMLVLFGFVLIGCSDKSATSDSSSDKGEKDTNTAENVEENENKKDPLKVTFSGRAVYENNQLMVTGETSLPPEKSHISFIPRPIGNSSFIGVSGTADVQDDGSFKFETGIPEEYAGGLELKIRFRAEEQTNESVIKLYGEGGENLIGPFVRLYSISDEKVNKEASVTFLLPKKEGEATIKEIPTPDWKKTDDYGDMNIRIEADVKYDKEFVNIEGKSNLLEGSELALSILTPEGGRSGSGDKARVNPDGSYHFKVENPAENGDLSNYTVRVKFAPSEYSWSNVWKHYGKMGEKMEGALIEMWGDEKQAIFLNKLK